MNQFILWMFTSFNNLNDFLWNGNRFETIYLSFNSFIYSISLIINDFFDCFNEFALLLAGLFDWFSSPFFDWRAQLISAAILPNSSSCIEWNKKWNGYVGPTRAELDSWSPPKKLSYFEELHGHNPSSPYVGFFVNEIGWREPQWNEIVAAHAEWKKKNKRKKWPGLDSVRVISSSSFDFIHYLGCRGGMVMLRRSKQSWWIN